MSFVPTVDIPHKSIRNRIPRDLSTWYPPGQVPRPLIRGSQMTIAAGFEFAGGIMFSADSQITHGPMLKTFGSKVAYCRPQGKGYSLLIAGAGTVDFMEAFFQATTKALDSNTGRTRKKADTIIRETLRDLYLEDIFPYTATRGSDAGIELLIAFSGSDGKLGFWRTASTAVLDAHGCECIGSGGYVGTFFAQSIHRQNMPIGEALVVATDLIRRVKDFDPNCSGETQIYILLKDGRIARWPRQPIARIEKYLKGCDKAAREVVLKSADPGASNEDADGYLGAFSGQIGELRQELEPPFVKALRRWLGTDMVR